MQNVNVLRAVDVKATFPHTIKKIQSADKRRYEKDLINNALSEFPMIQQGVVAARIPDTFFTANLIN